MVPNSPRHPLYASVEKIGNLLVELFHLLGLFAIGAITVWAAASEILHVLDTRTATLEDVLLLFIYLELGAMVGIYFRTHRLPVRYLIYIAITAITRHLAVEVSSMTLNAMIGSTAAILLLALSILVLRFAAARYPTSGETE